MNSSKFLQIHTLTSYPATLLNRDDAGFAKRLPFGGTTRTRVSSQCLKYHWRNYEGKNALYKIKESKKSFRSRETFQRKLAKPLLKEDYPKQLIIAAVESFKVLLLHDNDHLDKNDHLKKSSFKDFISKENLEALHTDQLTIFGVPEIKYLQKVVREELQNLDDEFGNLNRETEITEEIVNKAYEEFNDYFKSRGKKSTIKKNLKGLKMAAGLDAAMFGRMVTSDILSRGDAAIHVAHAFTTHAEESESDYFSAVDELRRDQPGESGELGAGHINSTELNSGLFYNYVVVDLPLLVSNLEAEERQNWQDANKDLASEVIRRLIHIIATVSPGAKLGSTAPYSYAQCLLVEAGSAQPRTLANAFQQAVSTNGEGVLANSFEAMGNYIKELDEMYGQHNDRILAAMEPKDKLLDFLELDTTNTVPEVADWAANQVNGDQ